MKMQSYRNEMLAIVRPVVNSTASAHNITDFCVDAHPHVSSHALLQTGLLYLMENKLGFETFAANPKTKTVKCSNQILQHGNSKPYFNLPKPTFCRVLIFPYYKAYNENLQQSRFW